MSSPELVDYYRRRAGEYEEIYAWAERQPDLDVLRAEIPARLAGREVLEIACGTGYWTERIARTARRIVATDLAEEPMARARAKDYGACRVELRLADAYALPDLGRIHDAAFAGFWWSHVPLQRRGAFLQSLHARLASGARVVMFDNRYVAGEMHPIAETDAAGNTYQHRRLGDGSVNRVLKNFPAEDELRNFFAPCAANFRFQALTYYWLAEYELR